MSPPSLLTTKSLLYIVGVGRSGTTALAELLNHHPLACVGIERYKKQVRQLTPQHFEKSYFFEFSEDQTNIIPKPGSSMARRYELMRAKWDTAQIVGDKVPNAFKSIDHLRKVWPGIRVIFCLRHIDGVANSWNARAANPKDTWPEFNNYREAVKQWNEALKIARKHVDMAADGHFFVLPYELFYRGEAQVADRLLAFLGLEWTAEFRDSYSRVVDKYLSDVVNKAPLKLPGQEGFIAEHADFVRYRLLLRQCGYRSFERELIATQHAFSSLHIND